MQPRRVDLAFPVLTAFWLTRVEMLVKLLEAAWSSGLGRWIWNLEVPGSNPPP